jgi:hypothetical protein
MISNLLFMFRYLTSDFVSFVFLSNTWLCCFCIFIVLKCRDLVLHLNYPLISLKFKPNPKSNGPYFNICDILSPPIFVCCTYYLWQRLEAWLSISLCKTNIEVFCFHCHLLFYYNSWFSILVPKTFSLFGF